MTSDIGGVLGTLDPRIRSGAYRLMGLLTRVSDYRMTTGRWDRGRAIGGNILTRLRVIR
jgi:hypothetical protein